jgi:hypothetical protein
MTNGDDRIQEWGNHSSLVPNCSAQAQFPPLFPPPMGNLSHFALDER